MKTGDQIKKARKDSGLTQKELGKLLGLSYQAVAQWENNLRNPKIETLQKISAALGVPVGELMGLEDLGGGVYGREMDMNSPKADAISRNIMKFHGKHEAPVKQKISDQQGRLLKAFKSMNDQGKKRAADLIEDLAKIPEYQAGYIKGDEKSHGDDQ